MWVCLHASYNCDTKARLEMVSGNGSGVRKDQDFSRLVHTVCTMFINYMNVMTCFVVEFTSLTQDDAK